MRSLRQFLDELTGIRLSATNVSLWNIQATVGEYARASLNDAITTFPVKVDVVAQSLPVLPNGFVVLPKHTEQVIQVETVAYSLQSRRDVLHWEFRPTVQTALLYLRDSISGTVEVTLQYRQPIFPAPVYVVSDSITAVSVSGAAIAHTWPPGPAFIELAYTSSGYLYREVALYNAVSPTGFSGLVRGVEGVQTTWPSGTQVSLCFAGPDQMLRPIMLMAQAVMYEHWLRDRALYDQYTAVASLQALPMDDLQTLIRDLEARARMAYSALLTGRKLPRPAKGRLRKEIKL